MIFRVYFNRHREAPQVWSIDEGTQASEVNVTAWFADGCPIRSRYNGEPVNDNAPSALVEIQAARYEMHGGVAKFIPEVVHDGRQ